MTDFSEQIDLARARALDRSFRSSVVREAVFVLSVASLAALVVGVAVTPRPDANWQIAPVTMTGEPDVTVRYVNIPVIEGALPARPLDVAESTQFVSFEGDGAAGNVLEQIVADGLSVEPTEGQAQ
ncbi:MAG: hypothetical protein ACFB6S_14960 [Geminicoccaceae bacterium]